MLVTCVVHMSAKPENLVVWDVNRITIVCEYCYFGCANECVLWVGVCGLLFLLWRRSRSVDALEGSRGRRFWEDDIRRLRDRRDCVFASRKKNPKGPFFWSAYSFYDRYPRFFQFLFLCVTSEWQLRSSFPEQTANTRDISMSNKQIWEEKKEALEPLDAWEWNFKGRTSSSTWNKLYWLFWGDGFWKWKTKKRS